MDEEVKLSEKENYVYNEKFCKQWFNNLDKKDNLPKKQLFGTFFKFNSNEFLLHIEVATNNLHIRITSYNVCYTKLLRRNVFIGVKAFNEASESLIFICNV